MASIPNQWITNAAEPQLKEAVAVDQRKLRPGFAGRIPKWIVRHGRGPGSGDPTDSEGRAGGHQLLLRPRQGAGGLAPHGWPLTLGSLQVTWPKYLPCNCAHTSTRYTTACDN